MFSFSVIAILLVAQIIAYKTERKLADTLVIVCCGFILVLYLLACFRILPWIDYLAIPIVIVSMFWIWRNGLFKDLFAELFSIQNICVVGMLVLLTFSQKLKIALEYDDIAYWATDIKALWYNHGFAVRYGNVAPGYGYYPPAIQLFRWFFVHIGTTISGEYIEGLGYAGYLCFNFIVLLPFISRINRVIKVKEKKLVHDEEDTNLAIAKNKKYYISDKRLVSKYKVRVAADDSEIIEERINSLGYVTLLIVNIFACICLVMLPTVLSHSCFAGISSDTTMGLIYGILMLFVWDKDREHPIFYFTRISLLGCVLVLCAPSGVCWALLAIAFMVANLIYDRRSEKYNQASLFETNIRYGFYSVLSWFGVWCSWGVIVLIKGRYSLTQIGKKTDGTVGIGYYVGDKIIEFIKNIVIRPMHGSSWPIGMSLGMCVILLMVFVWMLKKKEVIGEDYSWLLMIFMSASVAFSYIVSLVVCLTVFFSSTYNLIEFDQMRVVLDRGLPCILGMLVLLIGILLTSSHEYDDGRPVVDSVVKKQIVAGNYKRNRLVFIVVALFVLLCSNYASCYNGLWGYRASLKFDLALRDSICDDREWTFIETVASNPELYGKRVIYLKDATDVRWNHNAYINYAVVPVSVEFNSVSAEASEEDLVNIISKSNARYLYIEDIEGVEERLGFVKEWEHTDEEHVCLYRILDSGHIEPYRETVEE